MKKILAIIVLLFLWKSYESKVDLEYSNLRSTIGSRTSTELGEYHITRHGRSFYLEGVEIVHYDYILTSSKGDMRYYRNDSLVVEQWNDSLKIYDDNEEYRFNR